MCGIVGYIGHRKAYKVLMKGLHRLEYRGYDSAGIALMKENGTLNVYKSKGKVADLEAKATGQEVDGTIGIAHTRWATHGEPNEKNAHPQVSESGRIALVHNGTIENYAVLKRHWRNMVMSFPATRIRKYWCNLSTIYKPPTDAV